MRIITFFFFVISSQLGFSQEWLTDMTQASTLASEQHHNIILVFQGSDWCAPCMKLEQEIWSSEEFRDYASDHYILVKADFPRKKKNQLSAQQQKKNDRLAEKYNQEGYFPLVVILDPEGNVLGKTGYEQVTPEKYIQLLHSFEAS